MKSCLKKINSLHKLAPQSSRTGRVVYRGGYVRRRSCLFLEYHIELLSSCDWSVCNRIFCSIPFEVYVSVLLDSLRHQCRPRGQVPQIQNGVILIFMTPPMSLCAYDSGLTDSAGIDLNQTIYKSRFKSLYV